MLVDSDKLMNGIKGLRPRHKESFLLSNSCFLWRPKEGASQPILEKQSGKLLSILETTKITLKGRHYYQLPQNNTVGLFMTNEG